MTMMVQADTVAAVIGSETDGELLDQFLRGKDHAFITIFERYEIPLVRYLCHLTGEAELAKDLCQETMTRLIQKPPSGRLQGSLRAWLFRVAHNLAMDHLRKSGRMTDSPEILKEKPDGNPDIDDQFNDSEMGSRVRQLVGSLPENLREVLCLRIFGELRFREVAKVARLPLGTAIWRMNRAIESLRNSLKEEGWL